MNSTTNGPQQENPTSSDSATQEESTSVTSSLAPTTSHPDQEESSTGGTPAADPQNEETLEQETDQETDPNPANAEAAKYRRRLRDAEAQRDDLAAKLTAVTTNVIEEKLRHLNISAKALKVSGADLTALYDRDGTFSDEALLAAVEVAHETLGLPADPALNAVTRTHRSRGRVEWGRDPRMGYVPSAGTGGERPPVEDGWANVIQGR